MDNEIHVLLVEDDDNYARLIAAMLQRSDVAFKITHVTDLASALKHLDRRPVDAVLLDLTLPDSAGFATFDRVLDFAPGVPIIVLSGLDDRDLAINAVQAGAQDYLVKGQADIRWLSRSISYAIERHRAQAEQKHRIARLGILNDVDSELNHRLNVDYVLMIGLDTAVRLSLASVGIIGLIDDNGRLAMLQNINYDRVTLPDTPMLKLGVVGRCLRERKPQRVLDVTADPHYIALMPKMRAQIAIPLLSQSRVVGFLNLETTNPARFTEETFDFLKLLASRIASAVDNSLLYEQSQRQLGELQSLYEQVQGLEQMKTDMIRIATHDLRAPLNNVVGFTHVLRRKFGDALGSEGLSFLNNIEMSAHRMQAITNDILALEKLDAAEDITSELVNLQTVVERVFQENEGEARHKAQCFALSLTSRPIIVRGEPALLHEATSNLIHNAIKYTPDGGTVEVRLRRNGKAAIFKVLDTGYGIPADQQERLFQPFFRARSREVENIDGTGLGLHLVKNIITRHEGEMLFDSIYGQGSTFGFHLPLAEKNGAA
jgi:signal transduction histidine kinase/ActR/RegA family two-component response regulator